MPKETTAAASDATRAAVGATRMDGAKGSSRGLRVPFQDKNRKGFNLLDDKGKIKEQETTHFKVDGTWKPLKHSSFRLRRKNGKLESPLQGSSLRKLVKD